MKCDRCGGDHRGWETDICRKNCAVVHVPVVVHVAPVVHSPVVHAQIAVVHESGKYADPEARKAYRRAWMKKDRDEKRKAESDADFRRSALMSEIAANA